MNLYKTLVIPAAIAGAAALSSETRADVSNNPTVVFNQSENSAAADSAADSNNEFFLIYPTSARIKHRTMPVSDGWIQTDAANSGIGKNLSYSSVDLLTYDLSEKELSLNPGIKEFANAIEQFFDKHDLKGNFFCNGFYKMSKFGSKMNSKLNNGRLSVSYGGNGIDAKLHIYKKAF